jgi:hypothetical protein
VVTTASHALERRGYSVSPTHLGGDLAGAIVFLTSIKTNMEAIMFGNDLPLASYGLLGIFIVGNELSGPRTALLLCVGLALLTIVASVLATLVLHHRSRRTRAAHPPNRWGGIE